MEKWIGNHPTLSQKSLKMKYRQVLQVDRWAVLGENERVLKVIEAELDKRGGKEIDGIVALTDTRIMFISRSENSSYNYSSITNIRIAEDGKDKHEWKLSFSAGGRLIVVDDISKNDDTDEFFFILNHKVQNPNRRIETTVTHDFSYFIHAGRLEEFRKQNVIITPFLLKRDNQGSNANGLRLLKEKHPNALFIVQGNFKKDKAEGDYIVVDDLVYIYKYDNNERIAALLYTWAIGAFNGVTLDYFALKTVVAIEGGELTFNSNGKEFADLLAEKGAFFTIQKRKWHQKILGFRSGKLWKKSVASVSYLLILFMGMAMIGDEDPENKKIPSQEVAEANTEIKDDQSDNLAAEQKAKDEEAARLTAEKREKEQEAARIAAEQKAKEEAAEKKAKEEEAARLAAEKKAEEEEAALLAEQKAKEEAEAKAAAANVYYKNCDAVKAAGAAPIRNGDPGYSRKLDRDGDGIACEG